MRSIAPKSVYLDELLHNARSTPYSRRLIGVFLLVGMTEGYDVQAMAFAAPILATAWLLSAGQVGLLLTASVAGLVVGSFALSPFGDRFGRRSSILVALAGASAGTWAGAYAPNATWLGGTRFLAGLGLGLALPNVIALAAELAPGRLRTLVVVLISCGYPLGAAIGGAVAGLLIPANGHSVVFVVGGVGTLFAFVLCAVTVPESPFVLVHRPEHAQRLRALVAALGARLPSPQTRIVSRNAPVTRLGDRLSELFTPERRTVTMLLWTAVFANLALVYYFINWLPSLFTAKNLSAQAAVSAAALFSGSGVPGGLLMVTVMKKFGPSMVLGVAYIVAAMSTLVLASLPRIDATYLAVLSVSGAAIVGSQFCLTAVINEFYPSTMRSTASGYATGVGRVGALMAPLAGAAVLGTTGSVEFAFGVAAIPAFVALAAMAGLRSRIDVAKAQTDHLE